MYYIARWEGYFILFLIFYYVVKRLGGRRLVLNFFFKIFIIYLCGRGRCNFYFKINYYAR